jgi:tetratricopeptide (TPR) repeat protein
MKKLSKIFALLIFVGFNSYAQKAELQSAMNYYNWNDLEKAKTSIDNCTANESTMGMAKTWYWSGYIYQAILENKDPKYDSYRVDAKSKIVTSYQKALELDSKSKDYTNDIYTKLNVLISYLSDAGYNAFQDKKYSDAITNYDWVVKIQKTVFNQSDTIRIDYCGRAAYRGALYDRAIYYYSQLLEMNIAEPRIYRDLSKSYLFLSDTLKAIEILNLGTTKYPDNKDFIIDKFNLYLIVGKANEALTEIEKSIKLDSNNAILYFNKGYLAEKTNNLSMAETAYKKALLIDPRSYDALCNLAILYFNEGVGLNKKANEIKDNAKYEIARKAYETKFDLALPLFEKAFEINSKDRNVLEPLRSLYVRKGNQEKVNMINKAIEEAKK